MATARNAKHAKSAPQKAPSKKRVTFALSAPQARAVLVTGSFCDWQTDSLALKKDKNGLWTRIVLLAPGRHEYRFVVDGQWHDDPSCREHVANAFGSENCVVEIS